MQNQIKPACVLMILFLSILLTYGCSQDTIKSDESAETKNLCELGEEYQNTAVSPVSCNCPMGYKFETVSVGWGPCPREGMRDCPASVLRCVPEK